MYVPLAGNYSFEQVRTFAEVIGRLLATEMPEETTQERIYCQAEARHRHDRRVPEFAGALLGSALLATRLPACPGLCAGYGRGASSGPSPARFNLKTILGKIRRYGDLWARFWNVHQSLEGVLGRLEHHGGGGEEAGG
jgi:hypothetical protein